jgi:methyl-accepting chemotaxis protein
MSIKTKILFPLLGIVGVATLISGYIGFSGLVDHQAMASLADKAIQAGDMSRKAHDDFDRIGDLVAEVLAMTHFVDAKTIAQRFHESAGATQSDLDNLKAAALSPEMSDLAQKAIESFAKWRGRAEVVVGLTQAKEIVVPDVMKRDGDGIKAMLNDALALAGKDAQTRIADAGDAAKTKTMELLLLLTALAIAGVAGAFWLARNLSEPLKQLVVGAEKLAGGDVSVTFAASERRDEIGEISRAVARFRDNVTSAKNVEAEAAANRAASETERGAADEERRRGETEQTAVVSALAHSLARIAQGDLTARIETEFKGRYQQIKADFNAAIDRLKNTMLTIAHSTDTIQSGTREISSASDDLARRTEQQAASLQETAAALDEITATVKQSAEGASHARQVVVAADDDAKKSAVVVRKAVEAMDAIAKSAQQISQIIGVIDEIAFQTNLLALNAGVEAARAGDAGRGFAVVASEVRALAQRSADAAKQIKGLISTSTTQVGQGVKLVAETGKSLERIMAQVAEINNAVGEIAAGARQQAIGLQEVNGAINQMDQVTQQNAAMVEQSTAASHWLSQETAQLSDLVGQFQVGRAEDDVAVRRQLEEVAPHAFRQGAKDTRAAHIDERPARKRPARAAAG